MAQETRKKTNNLEIGVCCKTRKEHEIMLILIVYVQHYYNLKFKKAKRISLRQLVELAIKDLEKRGSAFYPSPEKDKTIK